MKALESEPKRYTRINWLQFFLFWSWNLIFLAFMSLGFAPIVLPETFTAVRTGMIPPAYLAYALVLAVIPVAAVILGLTVLRRSPARLFALGYVIEGPLMLMLAVRFFAIRQITPGTMWLMSIAFLGMAAFLWHLLDRRSGDRRPALESMRLAGLTLMALTSLYAAAIIAFYALPLSVEAWRSLVRFLSEFSFEIRFLARSLGELLVERPLMLPFTVLGFILLLYTGTLFVLAPIAVPYLSLRAWWRSLRQQGQRSGWRLPVALVGAALVSSVGLFFVANRQPQARAFALLEEPPASIEEAQSLLEQSSSIRAGLLNAYLAPFRYISSEGEVRHVRDIYASSLNLLPPQAYSVQRLYESFISPLLYKPVHPPELAFQRDNFALVNDPPEAARLYQRFFDTPIVEAERQTIVRAVRSTWSTDQAEAAWQAVDDREVHLVRQELTLMEQGDWANLELYEVYQNQTAEQQEVIYYFNLPESAVLTGVWLGDNPDKETAYSFQVAPRGAAQAVYREQTRQMKDPALLEQIGPRHYRLRVFPILPMRISFDQQRSLSLVDEAPPMHMWLAWRQLAAGDSWPMPQMAFLRNVYRDGASERLVNGQPMAAGADEWLPAVLPASAPVEPQAHRVDLPGGQTVLALPAGQARLPDLPAGLRLAVVVDRSRSMQAYASQVSAAMEQLKSMDHLAPPLDVYLTASPYRGEAPSIVPLETLNPQDMLYFGGQNAAELIAQFDTLRNTRRADPDYDAVIVLTDGTGYELGDSDVQASIPPFPVWVVHLGGDIPLGYDDRTLETIQASGGGVAGGLDEALARLAVALGSGSESDSAAAPVVDLVDGYQWIVLPTSQAAAALPAGVHAQSHQASEPFAALAARRLILAEMQRHAGSIEQIETLDGLHALAMDYQIVTPYSSMIVLVSWDQQLMLDRLSELGDRYQREVEELRETTPASPVPLAGVPEPHEWLLLGLVVALLIYLGFTKRDAVLGAG